MYPKLLETYKIVSAAHDKVYSRINLENIMMLPTSTGEKVLVSLRSAHSQVKSELSGVTLNELWKQLLKANIMYSDAGSDEQRIEIAQAWLEAAALNMLLNEFCFITDNITDDILDIASTPKTLKALFANKEHARTLAFACLCAITETNKGNRHRSNEAIVEAMSVFSERRVVDDKNLTNESAVHLFYGPATYTLYRTDVATDDELPAHLYQLNIPLYNELRVITPDSKNSSQVLPCELFEIAN